MLSYLRGRKTYIISFVSILYALTYYGWYQNKWPFAIDATFAALGLSTSRAALAKLEEAILNLNK